MRTSSRLGNCFSLFSKNPITSISAMSDSFIRIYIASLESLALISALSATRLTLVYFRCRFCCQVLGIAPACFELVEIVGCPLVEGSCPQF